MFCRYCGKKLLDEAPFCPFCGRPLETGYFAEPPAPPLVYGAEAAPADETESAGVPYAKPKKRALAGLILSACCLPLLILFAVFTAVSRNDAMIVLFTLLALLPACGVVTGFGLSVAALVRLRRAKAPVGLAAAGVAVSSAGMLAVALLIAFALLLAILLLAYGAAAASILTLLAIVFA